MTIRQSLISVTPLTLDEGVCITDIFQHFAQDNWAMLLDSVNGEHRNGRFDIIVANPIASITTKGEESEIWHQNQPSQKSADSPLTLVQKISEQYFPNLSEHAEGFNDLPFLAGALGYFAYDLGRRFESLPNLRLQEYQAPDMAIGIYSWSIIKDNQLGHFYLCSVQGYPHPSPTEIKAMTKRKNQSLSFSLSSDWQANMSQAEYEAKLAKVTAYLKAGDCYQTNLAQRFSASYSGDEWQAYLQLRRANQAPFSAFIRLPDSSILSISPERFLSVQDGLVQTKPIKGTRPRQQDKTADQKQIENLLSSEKDRAENLMIVDLLRNDLSKHCQPGSVEVPELFKVETFAAVHHLVSTVTAKLEDDKTPLDLLQGAFPGGSITGAPKIRAMQIIDELEPNSRNIYCGSIGYIGIRGDMDTSICIRTLLCEKLATPTIHCWAGGGIVIDSKSEDEYQESLDKVSKILPVLSKSKALNANE